MTPDKQVKEIIKLLDLESPENQTDAVFLVQKLMNKYVEEINAKNTQIALLEAQLEARSQEKQDIINEKLAAETRLKDEHEKFLKDNKGKTL